MSIPGYLGAMRNPMGVRWPARIKPDATPRSQFHHCNDIVPTIYEILGITPPREVNGVPQDPIDGVSLAYTFDDPSRGGPLADPVLRHTRKPRHLPQGLVCRHHGPPRPLGHRAAARHLRMDARQGHLGALQPGRGLDAGQRPRGGDAREAGPAAGALAGRGDQEQCAADRRRVLGPTVSPRVRPGAALHGVDVLRRQRPHPGVHRPETRHPAQRRHDRRRDPSRRQRRALQARRRSRAVSPASSRTGSSATSTTSSRSSARRSAPRRPSRPARRRSRSRRTWSIRNSRHADRST